MKVLVTGGAGFIGQHLCRSLLARGFHVCVLDSFHSQIHGDVAYLPADISSSIELFRGDIRDPELVKKALQGVRRIVHLAAETGTGQSMYEVDRYFSVNVQGTAVLLDALQKHSFGASLESIVVASSRAIYGEGAYQCFDDGVVYPESRSRASLSNSQYEPTCPVCGKSVSFIPTGEDAPSKPMSMYGLTKQVQEQAVLLFARTKGISGVALRYQNVFGPGQSLKNPYTGILAVFSNLARMGRDIEVYEDGLESRDFVSVSDAVVATVSAACLDQQFVGSINVGSGVATDVATVASEINRYFGGKSAIKISGAFRLGDIRHNKASLERAKAVLKYSPKISFQDGISQFLSWAEAQDMGDKGAYERSVMELASAGVLGVKGN